MSERLASSIGKENQHSVMFEVSALILDDPDHWLSLTMQSDNAWSPPVRFRFEKHDYDEGWDLVMRQEPK